ncbi:unnamed protein product [Linum trigynum]|uniref:RNase H type-1 domain-containing protein n=1 Tax=Linum trigynum TaxID=586398 RepID=A0AAV2F1R0_9ROSI
MPKPMVRWERPERGTLNVNVDAAKLKDGGTRMGMVIRDEEGKFVLTAVWGMRIDGTRKWLKPRHSCGR